MARNADVPQRACPHCGKPLTHEGSLAETGAYKPGDTFSTEPTVHIYRCDSCGRKYRLAGSGGDLFPFGPQPS